MSENKTLSEEQGKAFLDAWLNDAETQFQVGYSYGYSQAIDKALNAIEAGEIEEFVEWMAPKSMEEWEKIEGKYGKNYGDRWSGYEEKAHDAKINPYKKNTIVKFEQLPLF